MKKLGLVITVTLLLNAVFTLVLFNKLKQSLHSESLNTDYPVQMVNFTEEPLLQKSSSNFSVPENFVSTASIVTSAVVNITVNNRSSFGPVSGGSGVIIASNGYIITNNHVINSGERIRVTLSNNREYIAQLVGKDPTTDLALIKIEASNLPVLRYGDSDAVQVGEWVLAVGNPFNLNSTVTAGIVSAKGRNINILPSQYSVESFIQTDAVVNPGNSGGALVNMEGELIGINSAIMSESGGYEGYSFAIPSNLVKKIVKDLRDHGSVQRAVLGVSIRDVDNEIASDMGLPEVAGIYIRDVTPGSSAESAGLRMNDIIIAVNGVTTKSSAELQEQVARFRPGDYVSLDIIRNGRRFRKDNIKLQSLK